MLSFLSHRIFIFLSIFLLVGGFFRPSYAQYGSLALPINWPSDSINLSQLQQILAHNPTANPLVIQFPNHLNWTVTPAMLQNFATEFQHEAASVGVHDGISNFSFSSLTEAGLKAGSGQLSIPSLKNGGDLKAQIDEMMRQMRYQQLHLSEMLPDWAKRTFMTIYDAVYNALEYMSRVLVSLF